MHNENDPVYAIGVVSRIIGVHQLNKSVWIEDTVNTFAKAKQLVDNFQTADVIYYVHNDSNRIIYDSKKE